MKHIDYPTYDQILAIPLGTEVEAHYREKTGERCIATGNIHTRESGQRKVGPFILADMEYDMRAFRMSYSGGGKEPQKDQPTVPQSLVAIVVID